MHAQGHKVGWLNVSGVILPPMAVVTSLYLARLVEDVWVRPGYSLADAWVVYCLFVEVLGCLIAWRVTSESSSPFVKSLASSLVWGFVLAFAAHCLVGSALSRPLCTLTI